MKSLRLILPLRLRLAVWATAFLVGWLAAVPAGRAATYTWTQTAGGLQQWSVGSNWLGGVAPNPVAGDIVHLTADVASGQSISPEAARTIGTLYFGDTGAGTASSMTILNSGPLTFAGSGGEGAFIHLSSAGTSAINNVIQTSVTLGSALTVNTGGTAAAGQKMRFQNSAIETNGHDLTLNTDIYVNNAGNSGILIDGTSSISNTGGGGRIVTSGLGSVALNSSTASSYSGALEIRNTAFFLSNGASLNNVTDISVYGNAPSSSASNGVFGLLVGGNVAAPVAGRLSDSAVISLQGGSFRFDGASNAGTNVETIQEVRLVGGNNNLGMGAPGTTESELHMTDLTRLDNATLQIRGASLGAAPGTAGSNRILITNAPTLSGGGGAPGTTNMSILPWAVGSSTFFNDSTYDLVTYTSTGLRLLASSEYVTTALTGISGTSTTNNYSVNSVALGASSGNTTINALKYTATGTTSIGAGNTLTLTSGALLFGGNNGAIATGTLDFGAAEGVVFSVGTNTNTISSDLTGSGGLTKGGTGTLVLSGNNAGLTGGVTVSGGVLRMGSATALSANHAVTLANTTATTFGSPTSVTTALDLNGNSVTIGSLAGGGTYGGNVLLGSGTLTTGGNNSSTTYGGVISGTGGLTKTGTGTMTLTGNNTYTGTTAVNGGALRVNGALASNTITVGAGGTLGGTGTIAGDVTVFGTLAPGNSPGILEMTGDLTLAAGSMADFELGTAQDLVLFSGASQLLNSSGVDDTVGFLFTAGAGFTENTDYTLFDWSGATGFDMTGFDLNDLYIANAGWAGTFSVAGTSLVVNISAVPEPGAGALAMLGLAGLVLARRRLRRP